MVAQQSFKVRHLKAALKSGCDRVPFSETAVPEP